MITTWNELMDYIKTQEQIIKKQDEIISNKDIIISNLSKIIDLQEVKIKKLNNVINNSLPKTAHWTVVSHGYGDNMYICECSKCKDTVWVYKDAERKWNYCANCGAKMTEPMESKK